ncbi:MAG: hypothetical protein JNJ45_09525 [Chthonomonas sp.]|nr:hypothetical protein [Chthonomonas sp.]
MVNSRKNLLWGAVAVAFVGASVYWGGPRLKQFLRLDLLADYRRPAGDSDAVPMLSMGPADLELYAAEKKVGTCSVQSATVTRDRNTIHFVKVSNGLYRGKSGEQFGFKGEEGSWQRQEGMLLCNGLVNLTNKNFNLNSSELMFVQADQELRVPQEIKGKFYGGEISAKNLRYRLGSGAFSTGAVAWKGPVQDETLSPKKAIWKFSSADGGTSPDGEIVTYRTASATDGEILVKGDTIVHNRKTGVIKVTGKVRYYGKDVNMVCETATIYRKEKRVLLEKDVALLVKPVEDNTLREEEFEPLRPVVPESIAAKRPAAPPDDESRKLDREVLDPATRRKYPVRVIAERIEYWYDESVKRAKISGSPQARQELAGGRWRQVWCKSAIYDGVADRLRLVGEAFGVRMRSSRGDDVLSNWFEVSTKEGNESWRSGQLKGEFVEDEEPSTPTTPGDPPPSGLGDPPPPGLGT